MSLLPKNPLENPCQAASFEEAFRKNAIRLCFERDLAKDEYEQNKEEREEFREITDPAFWEGAMAANTKAFEIFKKEMKEAMERAALKIGAEMTIGSGKKAFTTGYDEIMKAWKEALMKNDPSHIVYW